MKLLVQRQEVPALPQTRPLASGERRTGTPLLQAAPVFGSEDLDAVWEAATTADHAKDRETENSGPETAEQKAFDAVRMRPDGRCLFRALARGSGYFGKAVPHIKSI